MPPPKPPKFTAIGFGDQNEGHRFTVTKSAEGEGKVIRRAHYGHVKLRLDPSRRGWGVQIESAPLTGVIPEKFIRSAILGIRSSLISGIDGVPIIDVSVTILDGSYHETDSCDQDFEMAGAFAVRNAVGKAKPIESE